MQRSKELAVLSREHHVVLELTVRLQRATNLDAETVTQATRDFWREEGNEHFRVEEELLLPAFAHQVGTDDADVVRVLDEHADIRRRVEDLETSVPADSAVLHALGERLRDHVRYEERTLFGRIETALSPGELGAVGAALQEAGKTHRPPRA